MQARRLLDCFAHQHCPYGVAIILASLCLTAGCNTTPAEERPQTWYEAAGWVASEYFDDPAVVQLCEAIEANDLQQIKKLVEAGADINARGKGNMTPLLWAYPGNELPRFRYLLEQGADPNVIFEERFGSKGAMLVGESVSHLAIATSYTGFFEAVFANGGDPNLPRVTYEFGTKTPLTYILSCGRGEVSKRVQMLVQKGANVDTVDSSGLTAAMKAVGAGNYDVSLYLLNRGADHRTNATNSAMRLIHYVVTSEDRERIRWSDSKKEEFRLLLDWLEAKGESPEVAREDIREWRKLRLSNGESRRFQMATFRRDDAQLRALRAAEGKDPVLRLARRKRPDK